MKHWNDYDNIWETEAWYFWSNMKVLLGHLDWGPGTKCPHSDPADKTFLGLCTLSNVSKWTNILLKMVLTLPPVLWRELLTSFLTHSVYMEKKFMWKTFRRGKCSKSMSLFDFQKLQLKNAIDVCFIILNIYFEYLYIFWK